MDLLKKFIKENRNLKKFIKENKILEIECFVPDISGVARGKILTVDKFISILEEKGMPLPESVFVQTVSGDYTEDNLVDTSQSDVYIEPDADTIRLLPWSENQTAQIICDAYYSDKTPVLFSSRYILKKIIAEYKKRGWKPVIAPEMEFYLLAENKDPKIPLEPPIGRSGRQEKGRQAYGIDAINEFEPIFKDIYKYCDQQNIDIDALSHEMGTAQIEVNFNHGDALALADQAFLFKRTVREVALKHGIHATFMAQPMQDQPGSAMHIHQSVIDIKTGKNIFSTENGENTEIFRHFIGGLQKHLPDVFPLFAPNVNSYRRFGHKETDSPINIEWGLDNRTAGLRVPISNPKNRRLENRLPGADANPYLAIASSLACGLLGIINETEPSEEAKGDAYQEGHSLPTHLLNGIKKLTSNKELEEIFGKRFVRTLISIQEKEFKDYDSVITAWERENLLLNV